MTPLSKPSTIGTTTRKKLSMSPRVNSRMLLALISALSLALAGCATTAPDPGAVVSEKKLVVAQVGITSTEFVACSTCPDRTRKVVALPPPVPPVVKPVAPPPPAEPKVYKVHFRFGSSTLDHAGRLELAQAVTALKDRKGDIKVQGGTDPVGSVKFNQRLALKRAQTVRKGLIAAGVPSPSITAGLRDSCCSGDKHASAAAHQKQRRADIEIILTTK